MTKLEIERRPLAFHDESVPARAAGSSHACGCLVRRNWQQAMGTL